MTNRNKLTGGIGLRAMETPRRDILQVYYPGMLASAWRQANPLELTRHGSALFVQPVGEKYSPSDVAAETATFIQDAWTRKNLGRRAVILVGVSMGGTVAHKVSELIRPEADEKEIHLGATMIDAPTGARDLKGINRIGAPLVGRLPFGPLSNQHLPRIPMAVPSPDQTDVPITMWRDQIASFAHNVPLHPNSLAVDSLATWSSERDNVVNGDQAALKWGNALADVTAHEHFRFPMEHAGFDNNPAVSRDAYAQTVAFHHKSLGNK